MNHQTLSSFIWSVADLLRGGYKQSDYGKVILPFTVLNRWVKASSSSAKRAFGSSASRPKKPFQVRSPTGPLSVGNSAL